MTVNELINELKKHDSDLPVEIEYEDDMGVVTCDEVDIYSCFGKLKIDAK